MWVIYSFEGDVSAAPYMVAALDNDQQLEAYRHAVAGSYLQQAAMHADGLCVCVPPRSDPSDTCVSLLSIHKDGVLVQSYLAFKSKPHY